MRDHVSMSLAEESFEKVNAAIQEASFRQNSHDNMMVPL
jgi:hypothetical protein